MHEMKQVGIRWRWVRSIAGLGLVLSVMVGTVGAQQWLEGRVFDAGGRPVEGVEIRVKPRAWNEYMLEPAVASSKAVARTDAQGVYRLKQLQAVWYFSKPGLATTVVRDPQGMVVMVPGRDVAGKVVDESGKPLAGVQLVSFLQYEDPQAVHGTPLAKTETQEDGEFVLRGVPIEGVALQVRKDGYYDYRKPLVSLGKVELRLQESGFVRGRIVDAQGRGLEGRLWMGYEVSRRNVLGHERDHSTGPDGSFAVPLRYRGRCRLRIRATGHITWESPVLDGARDLGRLAMIAAKLLSVRVVDSDGQALRGALVGGAFPPFGGACPFVAWEGQILANPRAVDEQGWARLVLDPEPSPWNRMRHVGRVGAWAPGFGARRLDVTLDLAQKAPAPMTIQLVPELTLEGVVVDEAGKPVAGAQVDHAFAEHFQNGSNWAAMMHAGRRRAPRIARTDPMGRFRIPGLSAGRYMLVATHRFRPAGNAMAVTIGSGKGKDRGVDDKGAGIRLLSYSGASLQGRLLGELMPGCIRVGGNPAQLVEDRNPLVTLHKDGRFAVTGLLQESGGSPQSKWIRHKVQLVLPRPPPSRMIPLVVGLVECKESTTNKEWRLNSLGLARVQGFVLQDVVPRSRLLIKMSIRGSWGQFQFSSVAKDGSFRLQSPPGRCTLQVFDWVTGVELHREKLFELKADQIHRPRIQLHPRVVDVQLGAAKPGVKVPWVHLEGQPGFRSDAHRDLDWGEKLRLYLPAAPYTLTARLGSISLVRMHATPLLPALRQRLRQPLGTVLIPAELGRQPGTVPLVILPVQAPPDIPD